MVLFERVLGVLVEPIGAGWASYSPASGTTHLLNDECAAILEVIGPSSGMTVAAISEVLAVDCGGSLHEVELAVVAAWQQLVEAGLIREVPVPATGTR